MPAETVSTSTKMDPESDIEDGLTTHSNCMQYGLDAAGNTDQPTTSTKIIQLDNDESGADRQNKYMFHKATGRQHGNNDTDASRPAELLNDEHSWQPGKQPRKKETSFTQPLEQEAPRDQSGNTFKERGCTDSNYESDLEEWIATYRETKRDLGIYEPLFGDGQGGTIPHIIQFTNAKTTSRVHSEKETISKIDAIKAILKEQLAMVADLRKPQGLATTSPSITNRETKHDLGMSDPL